MWRSLLFSSLICVLLPTATTSYVSFGSDSAVITSANIWNAVDYSIQVDSLMPGLPFRVYASQSNDIAPGDYTGNVVIRGANGAQFSLLSLTRKNDYVLSDENILYSPITITDLSKPAKNERLVPFVIYIVNKKFPAAPVISVTTNQSTISRIDSSIAKLSAPSCTILNSAIRMELSEMEITPTGTIEVTSAGYDTISQYTVLTVTNEALGSKLTIEGPIATLHNPTASDANFTFTLEHNVGPDRDLSPGAVTSILSQGWLSRTQSYESDYPLDPAPFRRRYSFGGRPALLSYTTRNNLPPTYSACELWCEQGDSTPVGPYGCQGPQGTAIIYIPTYCTAFNITIDPTLINDDPRFMLEIHTVDPIPPTTPAAPTIADPYCNCAVDASGAPDGWSYNDIWLDVIIIVDASEAMNDAALKNAVALVDSLISDGVSDYLITDTTKKFSTRIGVIEMTDVARVIYNLNMTTTDKIEGKIAIKKGVKEINVIDAFNTATNMFYFASTQERADTRQIVFYITESNPKENLAPLNTFKESMGVIIVNSLDQHAGLRNLASAGYYLINSDNKQTLGAFCKANCFCKPDKQAYGGSDPAITAAGGCYSAYIKGSSFSAAQTTCAKERGIIAVDHNDDKGAFLHQGNILFAYENPYNEAVAVVKDASPKSDYFWIGFSRNDGVWRWEDKSTDPYTNWEEDEPNSAAVARCAYVDSSTKALSWGAGNCNVAFPFVCEDVPCSVGYSDC